MLFEIENEHLSLHQNPCWIDIQYFSKYLCVKVPILLSNQKLSSPHCLYFNKEYFSYSRNHEIMNNYVNSINQTGVIFQSALVTVDITDIKQVSILGDMLQWQL